MIFRPASSADLDVVTSITHDAYAPYKPLLGGPPLPMTEDYAPRIARRQVWLVERCGSVVGLMVLEPGDRHLTIFSLAVPPAHQGQGVGRAIIAAAETMARTAGLTSLQLYTSDRMTRNIGIYTAAGFSETGRRPNPLRKGWVLVDMEKALSVP